MADREATVRALLVVLSRKGLRWEILIQKKAVCVSRFIQTV
jgi:hypothetical protein